MIDKLAIVIVEDDALIAMDLAELLIGLGHDVRAIATTEADAVAAAIRCDPDLMIVDAHLEDGSGLSAMRQILARGRVAHLYVTGAPQDVLESAKDAVVVSKPFNLRDLAQGIAKACRATGRPMTGASQAG